MSSVPWNIVASAATAGFAYANAKWFLADDVHLLKAVATSRLYLEYLDRRARLNSYYLLEQQALNPRHAKSIFLSYQGQQWTYRQAYDQVLRHGAWLKDTHGVLPGEIVALDFMNSPTFLWIWFGLWSIGASPSFINYNLTGTPLCHCVKACMARLLLVDDELRPLVSGIPETTMSEANFLRDGRGSTKVVYVSEDVKQTIAARKPIRQSDELRKSARSDVASLIYTSGTTGLPKAAIISWQRFNRGISFVATNMSLKPTDRYYTCMPLYHSAATLLCLGPVLYTGAAIVLDRKFSASTYWNTVRSSKATVIHYVGETCRYLLAAPSSPLDKQHNVRAALGNGLRPDVWERFKSRFAIDTIIEFYGATEGPGSTWNISRNSLHSGAVGRSGGLIHLLLGGSTVVAQLDADNNLPRRDPTTGLVLTLPRGSIGECLNRLNEHDITETYAGYFNNTSATTKKLVRDVVKHGDAFYRTGDLVRFSKEGHMYFVDRIGDTFRWKSENVATSEVPCHDGRAGCAALLLNLSAGETKAAEPTPELLQALATHAGQNLAFYATPLFLRFTPAGFATTGTNKTMKTALRDEGVEPERVRQNAPADRVYWLRGKTYVPFLEEDWKRLQGGGVKL